MNKHLGRKTTPQNTFNPMWVYNAVNRGTNDGSFASDAYYFLKEQGALELETLPYSENYQTWHPTEEYWTKSLEYRISDY